MVSFSVAVAGATDVVVLDRSAELDLLRLVLVESMGEDGIDAAEAMGTDGERLCGGRLKTLLAVAVAGCWFPGSGPEAATVAVCSTSCDAGSSRASSVAATILPSPT